MNDGRNDLEKTRITRTVGNSNYDENNKDRFNNIDNNKKIYNNKKYNRDRFKAFETEQIYNKKRKSNMMFYLVTLFIAVIFCLVTFAFIFNTTLNITSNPVDDTIKLDGDDKNNVVSISEEKEVLKITGVLTSFLPDDNMVRIFDISTNANTSFTIDSRTKLYDENDKFISFAEIKENEIVDIYYEEDSIYVSEIKKNSEMVTFNRVTGVEIDTNSKTFNYANKTYQYDDNLIVEYNNPNFKIEDLSVNDTVTLKGYRNKIYSIVLDKEHGKIQFINYDYIENAFVEINTDKMFYISNIDEVEVNEGQHHIVIKGDNIETYVNDIFVVQSETYTIDLETLPAKNGLLTINANVNNIEVTIDTELQSSTQPILLPYGNYVISITAEGYKLFVDDININKENTVLDVELEKIIKLAKIKFETIPSGAEVYVNERLVGMSPVTYSVEIGESDVLIKMNGYVDFDFKLFADQDNDYLFTLTKESEITQEIDVIEELEEIEETETEEN